MASTDFVAQSVLRAPDPLSVKMLQDWAWAIMDVGVFSMDVILLLVNSLQHGIHGLRGTRAQFADFTVDADQETLPQQVKQRLRCCCGPGSQDLHSRP